MCHYHKIINNDNLDTICNECKTGSRGCVQCKKELINNMTEFLKDYREKEVIMKIIGRSKKYYKRVQLLLKNKLKKLWKS